MKKKLYYSALSIVFIFVLNGCAVSYHPAEKGVSGYRDVQIDNTRFHIEYTEGIYTDWGQLHRFVLRRCAEIAIDRGYKFFDVISKEEKIVFLKNNADQIIVSNSGVLAGNSSAPSTFEMKDKKVEGRRVTYTIQLTND